MNTFEIPRHAAFIIDRLEKAGYEAYLVGGCVRDALLGREPADWDIASSAPPEALLGLFEKALPTGLAYGTVTVVCGGQNFEVTAFRAEADYTDGRRPAMVSFGADVNADLARRDFTVNAMAYHPARGFIDPFGGRADLGRRLIRAVGDPGERLDEDALRILRAFRFASQLGFEIEPCTLAAARERASLVGRLSGERVRGELERILLSPRPQFALEVLRLGALERFGFPKKEPEKILDGRFKAVASAPESPAARWAALFCLALPDDAENSARLLRLDNATAMDALRLFRELPLALPESPTGIKLRLSEGFLPRLYGDFLSLKGALEGIDVSREKAELRKIIENGEPYSLKMLAVSGEDLLELGIARGPQCGRMLRELLRDVIENPSKNDKNTLIALAKQAKGLH